MTKKLFRNAILILSFVLGGIFLNSCSDLTDEIDEENKVAKIADVSFAISDLNSDSQARTVLPNSDEHDLKKYLYLYNYTLTYIDESGETQSGEEKIICNDVSFDKFKTDSTIRLATGKKYKFSLKAKDGTVTRMEGSSIITLSKKPAQTVTIVLVPAGDEYGQKLRVDWIVPDDGVITKMKAGISPKRGYAEFQTEEEILVPNYRFQEYVFSEIDNTLAEDNPYKTQYGKTVKRIGITYDNVKTNVPRWLDYKFYDANGVLVYESSESVYMIGGKTSSTVIYITPDYYYRRPVTIGVKKGDSLWTGNSELGLKLVDKNDNKYNFTPVLDGLKNPTGNFEGLLPGKSSGDGRAEATDGIFDIYTGFEEKGLVKTGAKYNANTGKIIFEETEVSSVELVTEKVPQKAITLTPVAGVIDTEGTVGDGSGNGKLVVPARQNFTVKVELNPGYEVENGSTFTVGGKTAVNGGTVTLNSKDLDGEITYSGIIQIVYSIDYKSKGNTIVWRDGYEPVSTFKIESEDIELPVEDNFAEEYKDLSNRIAGWWFGKDEEKLDNIIHKINAEKTVKEKLIRSAVDKKVVLNVYWIPSEYIEYRLEYKFEELGSDPAKYIEDETVVYENGQKVVPFHNVAVKNGEETDIDIPQVPGFTSVEIKTGEIIETPAAGFTKITVPGTADETKEIRYKRNDVTITLDGNGGNWTDGKSTYVETLSGKFGASHAHVNDPVREDFRFLGWYRKNDATQTLIKHVDDHKFPAESVEYSAKWEQTHANYRVEFYYENVDSTYSMKSAYDVKGGVGLFPAFDTTPQSGFTYNAQKRSITSGVEPVTVVKADGSTLVKLYFDRKTVTFTLKSNGGKFTDGRGNTTEEIILEGKYGADLPSSDSRGFNVAIPQAPVLEGIKDTSAAANDFTFKGWHVRTEDDLEAALPAKFPAENAIYAARWNRHNAIYKIVHWAESLDNKLLAPKAIDGFRGQMLEGSVTKKGAVDTPMVYSIPAVTGFEAQPVEFKYSTGNITEDGKAEVIVTYLRKEYTINFHLNAGGDEKAKWCDDDAEAGNTEIVTRTGKYRVDFTPPANPVREHFIFGGWTTNTATNKIVDVVPSFKDPVADGTPTDYYAVWFSKASGGLETDTADISLVCTLVGKQISANVSIPEREGDWNYSWSVNNIVVSEGSGGVTFEEGRKVLKLSDCLRKDYEITVVVTHGGKVYTKTKVVTVE